jgi:catechol-2,3-dioxygenase
VEAQRRFFVENFGLAAKNITENGLCLQIGHTSLIFEQNPDWNGFYHYAFQIPEQQFDEAVQWLKLRCSSLENSEGKQEYFFDIWNAHAVYFADGDGNIGELIARHDHLSPTTTRFSGSSFLGVNEIGLVVEDVPATVDRLEQAYGLQAYLGLSHPEFTAVGDIEGLFIIVTHNRPWLPTRQPAALGWFSAEIETPTGHHRFSAGI